MVEAVIQKWGNSQAVRLPKAILNAANLHENDCVAIDVQEDQITLRKLPRRKTLDDLFATLVPPVRFRAPFVAASAVREV